MLRLFNTLSRKIEEFTPINPGKVGMYTCGPTVYGYAHIGHMRRYVGDDILRRILEVNNFQIKQVMNITDVGHLTSDEDAGEDKMEKGAKELGKTVWEVAKYYEEDFFKSCVQLNIQRPNVVAPATEHIKEQIKLIQKLEENGFVYVTDEAVYFDISKFPDYTKLSRQKLEEKEVGVRQEIVVDSQKRNPADFALWFFTVKHHKDHTMRWPSPWGEGFPGWHIECSAMSMEYLGNTLDIHTGGIDHIPVHHTNEIAQSEGATGEQFVRFWIHHEFLLIDGKKMSKSLKNLYTLKDLEEKGIDPLALRYLFLTAHYRDKLNFTWESLSAAQNALNNLRREVRAWESPKEVDNGFWQKFLLSVNNDLNTPQAVAVLHELIRSNTTTSSNKAATILEMDKILGLGLEDYVAKPIEIPEEVSELLKKREAARKSGNFEESDKLRKEIKEKGFEVLDTPEGQKIK